MRPMLFALVPLALGPLVTPALAAPQVVADIAPVHSLAAQVMAGVAEPNLLIGPGASPHGYALRPSEARALSRADLAIIMGEELTPWIHDPLDSLAPNAQVIELLAHPDTARLPVREGARFSRQLTETVPDHGESESEAAHGALDEGHAHEGGDPHAWLNPANASAWLALIAEELATLDPDNAATYRSNAEAAQDRIAGLSADLAAQLALFDNSAFLSAHDSWQYFETAFGVTAAGALSDSDAVEPGPARLRDAENLITAQNVTCVVMEGGSGSRMAERLAADADLQRVTLDPLGSTLAPGADQYEALLTGLAAGFAECLRGSD